MRSDTSRMVGFTLLEVAMVLLIVSALLASLIRPYGAHYLDRQRRQTQQQLYQAREALIGFAAANHRLPCPAQAGTSLEGDCSVGNGFLPAAALGLEGAADDAGFLLDAWNRPLRYSTTLADADADGEADFISAMQMQRVGMSALEPNLEICQHAAGCAGIRANQVTAVIYSTGANGTATTSVDELENLDGDRRFVSRDLDQVGDDQFDDVVIWLSENILYSKLIQAGVLP